MNFRVFIIIALAAFGCSCSKPAAKTAAADEVAAEAVASPQFSADSAFRNVAAQVAFGPRIGGSQAHDACGKWLSSELIRYGADTVRLQTANLDGFGPMTNILASFNGSAPRRILLLAHWDSRPTADEDPDPANHSKPIDGANDGASGVGVLLELARLMGNEKPEVGVDILFVDAEDAGTDGDESSWARGAQYFADNLPYGASEPMPVYGILLDMVGGRDARFPRELFSEANARPLNARVWALAKRLGLGNRFIDAHGGAVTDDHLPLLRAGIPTIDIIETANPQTGSFNPTWHTLADNIDNIDPATLADVGKLLTALVYSEKL